MKTRLAKAEDLTIIMDMIDKGRKHIQEYNIEQWINGYPSKELIIEDINSSRGYILNDRPSILDASDVIGSMKAVFACVKSNEENKEVNI